MQLRPALVELKGHGGIDGELSWAELTVHHTADANGDAFQVVDASADDVTKTFTIDSGVTEYTVTAGADTTVGYHHQDRDGAPQCPSRARERTGTTQSRRDRDRTIGRPIGGRVHCPDHPD
ncbi:hypothetical protein ACNQQN_24840 [Mycobacteroides chelonae]|uniref:hypothetical protein n=1 Tax=Mycobacteroides chelonae TaxID=1774 RepID=UPI003AAA75AD